MSIDDLLESDLWNDFDRFARRRKHDPVGLLATLLKSHMDAVTMDELDRGIGEDLRRSGVTPRNSVQTVREYRAEKKRNRAAA